MKKYIKSSVSWGYYDKFDDIMDMYLPPSGEGDTLATQVVTAITKLVYKWYNDGDVFDNTYVLEGWANDLSSYANWLYKYIPGCQRILEGIKDCYNGGEYEDLLKNLTDQEFDADLLAERATMPKQGSIYDCGGPFSFRDIEEDEDEYEDEYYEEDYIDEDGYYDWSKDPLGFDR